MSAGDTLAIGDRGLASFALAFAITQLVEVPIYAAALRGATLPFLRKTLISRVIFAFGASLLTHPFVWYVMPAAALAVHRAWVSLGGAPLGELGRTLLYGALAEGFAVIVEAFYLRWLRVRRALLVALFANAASVIVGTIVVRLI